MLIRFFDWQVDPDARAAARLAVDIRAAAEEAGPFDQSREAETSLGHIGAVESDAVSTIVSTTRSSTCATRRVLAGRGCADGRW